MKQFGNRWLESVGKEFVDDLVKLGRSGNGHAVSESPFGVTSEGVLDFRGLRFSEKTELRRVRFAPSIFGASTFKGIWLERCEFSDSAFTGASLQKIAEHGNTFTNCSFLKASFREAAIGYRGSRFDRCTFEIVDFFRAVFVRPEFNGCAFYNCKLNGVDLNGSSFEYCRFVGSLNDVWFRGGFAHPDDVDQYGHPRSNKMLDVSFESAALHNVTFSNQCDLSTVHMPKDSRHALVADWSIKLQRLQEQLEGWPESQRKAAMAFASTNLVHARTQDWFILNRDDLDGEFGAEVASRIWHAIVS